MKTNYQKQEIGAAHGVSQFSERVTRWHLP